METQPEQFRYFCRVSHAYNATNKLQEGLLQLVRQFDSVLLNDPETLLNRLQDGATRLHSSHKRCKPIKINPNRDYRTKEFSSITCDAGLFSLSLHEIKFIFRRKEGAAAATLEKPTFPPPTAAPAPEATPEAKPAAKPAATTGQSYPEVSDDDPGDEGQPYNDRIKAKFIHFTAHQLASLINEGHAQRGEAIAELFRRRSATNGALTYTTIGGKVHILSDPDTGEDNEAPAPIVTPQLPYSAAQDYSRRIAGAGAQPEDDDEEDPDDEDNEYNDDDVAQVDEYDDEPEPAPAEEGRLLICRSREDDTPARFVNFSTLNPTVVQTLKSGEVWRTYENALGQVFCEFYGGDKWEVLGIPLY